MGKTVKGLSYGMIALAAIWSALAIGNGKVGSLFGAEFFIASKDDMLAALVLNIVAIIGLVILGIMALAERKRRT